MLPTTRFVSTHSYTHYELSATTLRSNVDTSSPDYKSNLTDMTAVTTNLRDLHERIKLGGPEKARRKHAERKKMLPRE